MGLTVDIGSAAPLSFQLPDGAATKSVVATILTTSGSPVTVVNLTHRLNGLYTGSFTPEATGNLLAQFVVYTDNSRRYKDQLYAVRMEDYRVVPTITQVDTGAIAAAVWDSYTTDHTADGSFGAYVSSISSSQAALQASLNEGVQGLTNYRIRMSTSFDPVQGMQEVITWAEKNGQRAIGSNCIVSVRNALGDEVWAASLSSPNADGVFRFLSGFSGGADKNFYVVVGITVDGVTRVGQEPFFTVG